MSNQKTLVVIPTYNERENIGPLLREIFELDVELHVLIVDDDSPDGTGQIAEGLKALYPRLEVMHRYRERGRGKAGIAGFQRALALGADYIIEMDADFSHHPRYIPLMLKEIEDCDVVIGSRAVAGGADIGRSLLRVWITRMANLYIRWLFDLQIRDCTSGYRCFRRKVLETIPLASLRSTGPSIVEEILYYCHRYGFQIREIPIIFTERRKGKSSLTLVKLWQTYLMLHRIRWGQKKDLSPSQPDI